MNDIEKIKLTWNDIEINVKNIVNQLNAVKYDAILSVGRGGMIPARLIAEELDIHNMLYSNIKAYNDDNTLGTVQYENLNISNNLHNILVVDDCIFSGTTTNKIIEMLSKNKNIDNISIAVLYKNILANFENTDIVKYYYDLEYDGSKQWLIFPWEKK